MYALEPHATGAWTREDITKVRIWRVRRLSMNNFGRFFFISRHPPLCGSILCDTRNYYDHTYLILTTLSSSEFSSMVGLSVHKGISLAIAVGALGVAHRLLFPQVNTVNKS